MSTRITTTLAIAAVAVAAAACSSSAPESADTTELVEPASPDAQVTSSSEPVTEVPVPNAAGAERTVVRVETTGTFATPDLGQLDSVSGSGSAFIIDESGLAVTNNHVVAGAASIEVFFDDSDTPIPARVVARSECSDLAVIDLAGGGFDVTRWVDEPAGVGVEVRAAGYPLGDDRLTLTGGIVARLDDGATPWASIGSLLRHDAELLPGNSGGPLFDNDGAVVGVNVAASDAARYAIPSDVARPIIESLVAGVDVDSVGLNAVAVLDEVSNTSGVWVVSVEPGSIADQTGLVPGDIITRAKGVRVGRDATLADYCAVLRSTGSGELPIEVTRNGEFLAGSFRGASLQPVLEFTDDITTTAAEPPAPAAPLPAGKRYEAFDTVADDTEVVLIDVPSDWADRRTAPVFFAGTERPAIQAAPDVDAVNDSVGTTWDQPGVAAIVFSADVDIDEAFAVVTDNSPWAADCVPTQREAFDDGTYVGVLQGFLDCGDTATTVFSIALQRVGEPNWMLLNIFAPTVADLDAAIVMASTFEFTGQAATTASITDDETRNNDTGDLGAAGGDTVEGESELPATLSSIDDVLQAIGTPSGAAAAETVGGSDGSITLRYETSADLDVLDAWIDERTALIGCVDPLISNSGDGEYRYTSITCDYFDDGQAFAYAIRTTTFDGQRTEVDVQVIDWNA